MSNQLENTVFTTFSIISLASHKPLNYKAHTLWRLNIFDLQADVLENPRPLSHTGLQSRRPVWVLRGFILVKTSTPVDLTVREAKDGTDRGKVCILLRTYDDTSRYIRAAGT